ncbi:MAG TPA: helix-turn-helix domain-containing protein [Patescibacteria group bacterium]|nr:helix-turn-helix domain-containing protein [Patescibacteria group bacterium]
MLQSDLEKLGLTKNEATIYLALYDLGKSKAADIIQKTDFHRNIVYKALDELVGRRLVSKTTMGKVLLFQTTDPTHLLDVVREQDLTARQLIESLKERKTMSGQEITIYEGEEGIRAFCLKIAEELQPEKKINILGSVGQKFQDAMGSSALKRYFSRIAESGGTLQILMYHTQTFQEELLQKLRSSPGIEMKIIPFDSVTSANIVITETSVAFLIFETPFSVIEVKNTHLIQAYRAYFDLLWNQETRISHGWEALERAFYGLLEALRPGEEYCVMGANTQNDSRRFNEFFDAYHRERIHRGVMVRMLAYQSSLKNIRDRFSNQGDPEGRVSFLRAFSEPSFSPMQIMLYRNKTLMILMNEENPTVIEFDRPEVYEGFKSYFDELWNRNVEVFTGPQAIIELCERVLTEGKEWYLIGANGFILQTHPEYYKTFTKRRVEKGFTFHMLAQERIRNSALTKFPMVEVKYLPPPFDGPIVFWIFGDYVANVLWHDTQTVFLIHDKKHAQDFMKYYESLKKICTD